MQNIRNMLKECLSIEKPSEDPTISLYNELDANSHKFPIKFPLESVRCHTLVKGEPECPRSILEENIQSTYPLIHEKVLILICKFLLYKREHGSHKEKELYRNMGIKGFVDRLLLKRSVVFFGRQDKYLLLTGETGMSGWMEVGTDDETEPLVLMKCLSYDEMKISAMLYVSGGTVFINNGCRTNRGVVTSDLDTIERFGVIIGLIGTRLTKKSVMEYQEIIIDEVQNIAANGYYYSNKCQSPVKRLYSSVVQRNNSLPPHHDNDKYLWRQLWNEFYGEPSLTYDEALQIHEKEAAKDDSFSKRFNMDENILFDNYIYSQHISIAFDCALLEADSRAAGKGKMAFLHVVGIGLGVWREFAHQDDQFIKVFLERIKILSTQLPQVSDVYFSYMQNITETLLNEEGTFIKCESHPFGGIKIHLGNREPSSNLSGEDEGKLLVETYAWNGNSQPGNVFWKGYLQASSDPAAACSSQISELHNSHINTRFVCSNNLHVAGKYGILHIAEYAKRILTDSSYSSS